MTINFSTGGAAFHFIVVLTLIALVGNFAILYRTRAAVKRTNKLFSQILSLCLKNRSHHTGKDHSDQDS